MSGRPSDPPRDPCAEVEGLVAVALDGRLPAQLEAHVDGCDRCLALLDEALSLGDAIRDAGDGYRHAPDFEARVRAALDSTPAPPPRRLGLGA